MRFFNIAVVSAAIAGFSILLGGCSDSTPTPSPKVTKLETWKRLGMVTQVENSPEGKALHVKWSDQPLKKAETILDGGNLVYKEGQEVVVQFTGKVFGNTVLLTSKVVRVL